MLQKTCRVEPEDPGLPGVWQTKCCIHMCVSEKQFKVAPKGQRLHGIGRPTAAASIHVCAAEYINSGLHLSVKGYNSLADQLLLREHTCDMCVAEKINSGLVWPTTSWSENTHVCNYKGLADQEIHICVPEKIHSGLHARI